MVHALGKGQFFTQSVSYNCRIATKAILLSAFAKLLLHSQPQDPELRERVIGLFKK